MSIITDRELLTFSNSTNLDWQFLNAFNKANRALQGNQTQKLNLNEILKPESFVRKNEENPDVVKYIYSDIELSEGEELTQEQIEEGLDEMRRKAPVVMN